VVAFSLKMVLVLLLGLFVVQFYFTSIDASHGSNTIHKHARTASQGDSVVQETASGDVRGTTANNGVRGFYAVPYAQNTIGSMRFKPPKPVVPWANETLDATLANDRHIKCPQFSINDVTKPFVHYVGDEDCLTLDFFVPPNPNNESLPVMVFIHGGGFWVGDDEKFAFGHFDGTKFAEAANVILFTVNYRLGPLGFLAHPALTFDDNGHSAVGNLGLRDQRLAMEWAKATAPMLGGDVNRITIFGQSAGGMSICYHYTSQASASLFSSAIIESGNCGQAPQVWTDKDDAMNVGIQYVKAMGCDDDDGKKTPTRDADAILKCLQSISVNKIMEHAMDPGSVVKIGYAPPLTPVMPWTPTVDGSFGGVIDSPLSLVRKGKVANKPVIAGHTKDEMKLFVYLAPFISKVAIPLSEEGAEKIMRKMLMDDDGSIVKQVLGEYSAWDYASPGDRMEAAMRDWFFACDMSRFIRATTEQGTTNSYLYRFSYPIHWIDSTDLGMKEYHASELPFVFHMEYPPIHVFDDDDEGMFRAFVHYWGKFASSASSFGDDALTWPSAYPAWSRAYGGSEDAWMELGQNKTVRMVSGLNADRRCSFWDSLMEKKRMVELSRLR